MLFMPGIATYLPYQCRHRNVMRRYAMYEGVGRYARLQVGMPVRNVLGDTITIASISDYRLSSLGTWLVAAHHDSSHGSNHCDL